MENLYTKILVPLDCLGMNFKWFHKYTSALEKNKNSSKNQNIGQNLILNLIGLYE